MSSKTVARQPLTENVSANFDASVANVLMSSGKTKRKMQTRRCLDNARKFQEDKLNLYRLNGECVSLSADEVKKVQKQKKNEYLLKRLLEMRKNS